MVELDFRDRFVITALYVAVPVREDSDVHVRFLDLALAAVSRTCSHGFEILHGDVMPALVLVDAVSRNQIGVVELPHDAAFAVEQGAGGLFTGPLDSPLGKALLAEMSQRNAQFCVGDCQMKAILAEIVRPTEGTP